MEKGKAITVQQKLRQLSEATSSTALITILLRPPAREVGRTDRIGA